MNELQMNESLCRAKGGGWWGWVACSGHHSALGPLITNSNHSWTKNKTFLLLKMSNLFFLNQKPKNTLFFSLFFFFSGCNIITENFQLIFFSLHLYLSTPTSSKMCKPLFFLSHCVCLLVLTPTSLKVASAVLFLWKTCLEWLFC